MWAWCFRQQWRRPALMAALFWISLILISTLLLLLLLPPLLLLLSSSLGWAQMELLRKEGTLHVCFQIPRRLRVESRLTLQILSLKYSANVDETLLTNPNASAAPCAKISSLNAPNTIINHINKYAHTVHQLYIFSLKIHTIIPFFTDNLYKRCLTFLNSYIFYFNIC